MNADERRSNLRSSAAKNLPSTPNAGYGCRARRTLAIAGDFHLSNQVTESFDQQLVARRAISVFPATNPARKVSGVNVFESRFATELTSADQLLGSGV